MLDSPVHPRYSRPATEPRPGKDSPLTAILAVLERIWNSLRGKSARVLAAGAVLLVLLGGTACGPYPQSTLSPVSDFGASIDRLFNSIFWWSVVVFVVVEGLLLYAVFRYRDRPEEEVRRFHGSVLLEFGWTLAPAVILVLIAVPTIRTIFEIDRRPEDVEALPVEVVAHQWWWEFRYPESGVVTANEIHVPTGERVELRLASADVIHSFWVPKMGGKRDVIPGKTNYLWFTMDSAGVYPGQCAEFCGPSHALMQMRLVARPPAEFRAWIEEQQRPQADVALPEADTAPPGEAADTALAARVSRADSLARQGKAIFMRVCLACHTVRGTRAQGTIGPDLTHFMDRRTLAAGIMENTAENRKAWLARPQEIKPANQMLLPRLTGEQIEALNAYLETLE